MITLKSKHLEALAEKVCEFEGEFKTLKRVKGYWMLTIKNQRKKHDNK